MKKPEWIKRLLRREENPDEMHELFPEEGNILAIILSVVASFFLAAAFITIILLAEWLATGY